MELKDHFLEELIHKKVLKNGGKFKVVKVNCEPAVGKNENYLSDLVRVTVILSNEKGERNERSLILKLKTEIEKKLHFPDGKGFFDVEIMAFNNILSEMEKLVSAKGGNLLWPQCYYTTSNEIIMEDLKASGYEVACRKFGLDPKHSHLVMAGLGKLHALSMVLVEQNKIDLSKMSIKLDMRQMEFINYFFKNSGRGLATTIEKHWGDEWKETAERVRTAYVNVDLKLLKLWKSTRGNYDVINHGDNWTNNIMFQYDPVTKDPTNLRFIDFQGVHYNSFAYDILYFLYTSVLFDVRQAHLDAFLKTYAQSLADSCRQYGYRGRVFSLEDVHKAYQELLLYGFFLVTAQCCLFLAALEKDFSFDLMDARMLPEGAPFFKSELVNSFLKKELKFFTEKKII